MLPPFWIEHLPPLAIKALKNLTGLEAGFHPTFYQENQYLFSEYRPYVPGDSLRLLDWKVFARTEKLFCKKFFPRTAAQIWFCLDASASLGKPFLEKWHSSCELFLTLSYLFLRQGDKVQLALLQEKGISCFVLRDFKDWGKASHQLTLTCPEGKTDFSYWSTLLHQLLKGKNILFVFSDFLAPSLASLPLFQRKQDLIFFQVLHEQEKKPEGEKLMLEDVETRQEAYFEDLPAYEKAFAKVLRQIEKLCQEEGIPLYRYFFPEPPLPLLLTFLKAHS